MEQLVDALPAVYAFLIISILTAIGLFIRQMYKFTKDVRKLLYKEMTNGKPADDPDNENLKDIMVDIRNSLVDHHGWAQSDAHIRNEKLDRISRQTEPKFPGD